MPDCSLEFWKRTHLSKRNTLSSESTKGRLAHWAEQNGSKLYNRGFLSCEANAEPFCIPLNNLKHMYSAVSFLRCLWFYTFVTCLKIFLRIKFLPVCGVDAAGSSRSWFLLVLSGLWASPLLWTEQSKHLEVHAGQDGEDQHWDNCTLLVVSFPLGVCDPHGKTL